MKPQYLILFLFLVQLPLSLVSAQEKSAPFFVQVRTDKGKVSMAFRTGESEYDCFVGYHEYNKPCIPVETKGEIFIPDSIVTPNGQTWPVRWISRGSFQGCQNITKIHLSHSIEFISDYSFQNCKSLREITLSDSLQSIYPRAFAGCNAIRCITFKTPYPPRTYIEGTFEESILNTATIVVPAGTTDRYRKDNLFSRFRYHAELLPICPGY